MTERKEFAVLVKCLSDYSVRVDKMHVASGDEITMNALAYGINHAHRIALEDFREKVAKMIEEYAEGYSQYANKRLFVKRAIENFDGLGYAAAIRRMEV
jgi:lysophospholipase L1-like esterase